MITKKEAIDIVKSDIKKKLNDSLSKGSIYGTPDGFNEYRPKNTYSNDIDFKDINVEDEVINKYEYYKITIIKANVVWTETELQVNISTKQIKGEDSEDWIVATKGSSTNTIIKYYKGELEGLVCYINKETGKYSERKENNKLKAISVDKAIEIARKNLIEEEYSKRQSRYAKHFINEFVSWFEIKNISIEEEIIKKIKYYKINVISADVSFIRYNKILRKETRYSYWCINDIVCYVNKKTGEYFNNSNINNNM